MIWPLYDHERLGRSSLGNDRSMAICAVPAGAGHGRLDVVSQSTKTPGVGDHNCLGVARHDDDVDDEASAVDLIDAVEDRT